MKNSYNNPTPEEERHDELGGMYVVVYAFVFAIMFIILVIWLLS